MFLVDMESRTFFDSIQIINGEFDYTCSIPLVSSIFSPICHKNIFLKFQNFELFRWVSFRTVWGKLVEYIFEVTDFALFSNFKASLLSDFLCWFHQGLFHIIYHQNFAVAYVQFPIVDYRVCPVWSCSFFNFEFANHFHFFGAWFY